MPNKGPLVGRGEELRVVADALGARPTSGVVVAGSAGVGKTRLARQALEAAARGGAATLWAVATASSRVTKRLGCCAAEIAMGFDLM